MLKLKGKLDFTLFLKLEGVDPVNGKRPNRNIKKKFVILGIAIISTSQGIMTDKQARKLNIGGEVLAYIW
jgi:ribosomal protein S8